jgi:hypothetical protein
VQQGDGAGGVPGVLGGFTKLILCSTNLPDKGAIALDVQMDDGLQGSGAVRGQQNSGDAAISTVAVVSSYQETGVLSYTLCRQF